MSCDIWGQKVRWVGRIRFWRIKSSDRPHRKELGRESFLAVLESYLAPLSLTLAAFTEPFSVPCFPYLDLVSLPHRWVSGNAYGDQAGRNALARERRGWFP